MTAKQFGDVVESRASRVRIARLLRGVVAVLPRGWIALRGLIRLSKARPERCESIGTIVEHWARARPDHPAIVYEGRYISYAEFNACANRWAACLRGLGIGKGASVGILMENRPELLTAVLAVVKLGWPAGMLNPRQRGAALAHSIRLIRAEVLLVGEECLEAFHSVKKEMPPALLSRTFWLAERSGERCPQDLGDFVAAAETNRECSNPPESGTIRGSDPAFYIFTSGTTGLPKASVRTHNCWMMSVAGIGMASLQMRRDDVLYCVLPFYHNTALTVAWSAVLAGGGTLAIARKFSASSFWDEIRAANATVFCYVGELCRYLLARPPSAKDRAHRIRVCVGNGLRPELWAAFRDRFGIGRINEFYGTSEHCLAFTNAFNIEGSCGFCPLPFAIVEYDIERDRPRRNAKGRLTRIVKGEVGLLLAEITQRTPFDGYTDAAESEKRLLRDVFKPGDCYYNTGDLVRDMGFRHIQFIDRLGDTFRWKGENVATTEVERAFDGHAAVEEAVVYGVQVPGCEGRVGMAALTLRNRSRQILDGMPLVRHLRKALPPYAVPLFLRIRSAHDTTTTFKLQKSELKREGWRGGGDPVYVLLPGTETYQALDQSLAMRIERGELRF